MCPDDSGVGILNSNSGVIDELSGQQSIVKIIISSPQTIPTIKREKFNKKILAKNLKKG